MHKCLQTFIDIDYLLECFVLSLNVKVRNGYN